MSRIDWSTMTPREVWEALKSAPRVAGPWVDESVGELAHRRGMKPTTAAVHWPGTTQGHPYYATRDEADATLRAAGWLLVDDAPPAPPATQERDAEGHCAGPGCYGLVGPAASMQGCACNCPRCGGERDGA